MNSLTDWELIQQCRNANGTAWSELITRYERLVFAIPLRYGMTREDASDIVQLTFTLMLDQLGDFHEDSNVKGWLGTVARRHSWRMLQRYDHEQVEAPEDVSDIAERLGMGTEDATERMAAVEWLYEGMQELGEPCQGLLYALYFDEASYKVISAEHNIPVGSIGPTRKRCLNKLKRILQKTDSS